MYLICSCSYQALSMSWQVSDSEAYWSFCLTCPVQDFTQGTGDHKTSLPPLCASCSTFSYDDAEQEQQTAVVE